jgi:serine protease Do
MNQTPSLKPYFVTCTAIFVPLILALVIFSQFPEYGLADLMQGKPAPAAKAPAAATPAGETKSVAAALDQEFQKLADGVMPSVVSVNTSKENLFKHVVLEKRATIKELQGTEYVITPGVGSGVIVSKDGYIITCWHVIKDLDLENGRDFCSVTLHQEHESREVDLVGMDRKTDLAVLKLRQPPDHDLPALSFGDSDLMHRGNIVMAVGSPFGLFDTVSQGILSNCDRKLGDSDEALPYFQTDCVINPGNSGGPLVNLKGEIIGINWALYSGQTEVHTWQGIGLVVRSNEAKAAMESILHQSGPRPYLGVGIAETKFDPQKDTGRIYITDVTKDSPAAQAGLLKNDTIEAIDSLPVTNEAEAWKRMQRKLVGEVVEFSISRPPDATTLKIQVTVADMDKNGPPPPVVEDLTKELGLKVKNCDGRERFTYKMRQWVHGDDFVVIWEVDREGPLAGKVKPGDILYSLDGATRIKSTADLKLVLAAQKGKQPVALTIWREAQPMFEVSVP